MANYISKYEKNIEKNSPYNLAKIVKKKKKKNTDLILLDKKKIKKERRIKKASVCECDVGGYLFYY